PMYHRARRVPCRSADSRLRVRDDRWLRRFDLPRPYRLRYQRIVSPAAIISRVLLKYVSLSSTAPGEGGWASSSECRLFQERSESANAGRYAITSLRAAEPKPSSRSSEPHGVESASGPLLVAGSGELSSTGVAK